MICLIGSPLDRELLWLAAALQRRGQLVELVLPEELMIGSTLSLRIDEGRIASTLRLHDGRVIDAATPHLVINRLADLPSVGGASDTMDGLYLAEEWRAVLAAWLRSLHCPVLNPPRAASLAGPVMTSPAIWRAIARHFGLPARAWTSGDIPPLVDPAEVICLGDVVFDPSGVLPDSAKVALGNMARHVGAPLIGVIVDRDADGWEVVDATTAPRFSVVGEPFVDAVIALVGEYIAPC
jgi:hypothetical protein